jgi:hypothetical protein
MFTNLTGLLPLISVASLLIVSANTIGYFARIDPHFLGLKDFTNFVYPLGLAFLGVIVLLQLLSIAVSFAHEWRNVAEFNLKKVIPLATVLLAVAGIASFQIENTFYKFLTFTGVWIGLTIVTSIIAFVGFHRRRGKLSNQVIMVLVITVLITSYISGMTQAEYQAFETKTLYKIIDNMSLTPS